MKVPVAVPVVVCDSDQRGQRRERQSETYDQRIMSAGFGRPLRYSASIYRQHASNMQVWTFHCAHEGGAKSTGVADRIADGNLRPGRVFRYTQIA